MQQVELTDADGKRSTELQKAIVKARIDTTHDVLRKIRPQMDWVVTSLYNEFEQTRRAQREQMIADFNNIIRYPDKYHDFQKRFSKYRKK